MSTGKVGLVISGGAGKTFFHIGALKAITTYSLDISYIVAVSGGAIIAAKFLEIFPEVSKLEAVTVSKFQKPPFYTNLAIFFRPLKEKFLLNNKPLKNLVAEIDAEKIIQSPIQLDIVTVNLISGKEKIFSNRNISPEIFKQALVASTALPGIFPSEIINNETFIDGGMINPLPIRNAIDADCDTVIVLESHPKQEEMTTKSWFDSMLRGFQLSVDQLSEVEIIRSQKINSRVEKFLKIKNYLEQLKNQEQDTTKLNLLFEIEKEAENYFQRRRKIEIIIIRPEQKLLSNSLKWSENDIKMMIKEGEKIAKKELEKNFKIPNQKN